jgi:hypothetical protein
MSYVRPDTRIMLAAAAIFAFCGCKRDPSGAVIPGPLGVDGAVTTVRPVDPGILADQSKYQPAKAVGGGAASAGGGALSGDAAAQVGAALTDLNKNLNDQEVAAALGTFDPATVTALGGAEGDLAGAIANTFERISELRGRLNTALGEEKTPAILEALPTWRKTQPKLDMLDENTVNITTDLPVLLFGADHGGLRAVKQDNKWSFTLGTPLAAEDPPKIKAYHEGLQKAIDDITVAVDKQTLKDEAQIRTLLADAVAGKPITVPAPEGGATPAGEPGAENGNAAAPNANDNTAATPANENAASAATNENAAVANDNGGAAGSNANDNSQP